MRISTEDHPTLEASVTKLKGKRALVTGATQGIGRGIAERLQHDGADITGTYRESVEEAEKLRDLGWAMIQADFSTREGTRQAVEQLSSEAPYDYIVNNAGIVEFESWSDFSMDAWDRTLEVNLNAPLLLVLSLTGRMPAGGSVVNIVSTDGYTGSFGSIAYAASKAALINLTKSLGNVLGERGIRANAVAPGWVDTGMSTDASYDATRLTPLARNGTPADIAGVVSFLLSPEAAFINGATIIADGGYTNVDSIMKRENDDLKA
jgi:NAD(P)-dependent dehydrogenase (short-subunit alcohol dehydrogenase family)